MKASSPPLARYKPIRDYQPQVGDFVIWTGWFKTWYGVVAAQDGGAVSIVFENIPCNLFTLSPDEQVAMTQRVSVAKVTMSWPGTFAVLQHDSKHNASIWYI